MSFTAANTKSRLRPYHKERRSATISLYQQTHALLVARLDTLEQIAKDAGVPYHWLRKFSSREIKAPCVDRVQKLYRYLAGEPLL